MNFDKLITAFLLTGLLCGASNTATADVNAADCMPLLNGGGFFHATYTDCREQQRTDKVELFTPLAIKAGTTVEVKVAYDPGGHHHHAHGAIDKKFSIENGKTIWCTDTDCFSKPAPSNCKSVDVIYENAHYWVDVYYTPCGTNGQTMNKIPSEGQTLMAQENTEVLMGPDATKTKNYLNYDYINNKPGTTKVGSNGLNIKCWGLEGSRSTGCKTY